MFVAGRDDGLTVMYTDANASTDPLGELRIL